MSNRRNSHRREIRKCVKANLKEIEEVKLFIRSKTDWLKFIKLNISSYIEV